MRSYICTYSVEFQLTDIIWGGAGESDDHIVPYPDQVEEKPSNLFGDPLKKEINQQTSKTSPPEQKNPRAKAEHGVELDSNCKHDTGELAAGFGHTSRSDVPDPSSSSSNVANAEHGGSATAFVTKNIIKSSECDSGIGELRNIVDFINPCIHQFDLL